MNNSNAELIEQLIDEQSIVDQELLAIHNDISDYEHMKIDIAYLKTQIAKLSKHLEIEERFLAQDISENEYKSLRLKKWELSKRYYELTQQINLLKKGK